MGKKSFHSLKEILDKINLKEDKYVSREFQDYGYHLAQELNDLERKALYIKLAKEKPRFLLEKARNFVKEAYGVKNKAKLFMWKLKDLKKELPNGQK
ncbi:hypothetical protein FJZ41_02250 [Candidatus Shapirobacteria bacterium]|nr:hypothetical protein [Candidatus Shapirobacteria bacterium]